MQGILKIKWLFLVLLLASCGTPTVPPVENPAFDPNLSAARANLTANAAQQEAELYSIMATGTAQAPIIAITQTAAGFSLIQTQAAATSIAAQQTQAAQSTTTALSWTATPNLTATYAVAQSNAQGTQIANMAIEDNQRIERGRITNTMKAVVGYAIIFVLSIIGVMYAYVHLKRLSLTPNPVDERGKAMPMINVIDAIVSDVERAPNGMAALTTKYLKQLPAITAERQSEVTARSQMVDLQTRIHRIPKRLLDTQGQGVIQLPAGEPVNNNIESQFLLPDWNIINGWDSKDGLPYYTAKGLEVIDTDRVPHISTIGGTGSGKSRRFFRPMIACALAAGHRVIIIGKSTDYFPFESHPNVSLLKVNKITEPGQALRYAQILEAIVTEMNRRDDILTTARQSTWTRAGYPRTFIFLDELGNALRLMDITDRATANRCRTLIEGLVSEGRKAGFNLMVANQRATGMISIFSQTGKAIFRIDTDEERAHKSLIGASSLQEGYFMARFGAPKMAGGFEPTDAQISEFLAKRQVKPLEPDGWVDAVLIPDPALPERKQAALESPEQPPAAETKYDGLAEFVNSLDEKETKILELYQAGGFTAEDITLSVYGYSGGWGGKKVKRIIERYRAHKGIADDPTVPTPDVGQKEPVLGNFVGSSAASATSAAD